MFIIRWTVGVLLGLLLAAKLVFVYTIIEKSPKAVEEMESTVSSLIGQGREFVDTFEVDKIIEKIGAASSETSEKDVTPEAVDDDPPIAADATPPRSGNGIAEMPDAQQIETAEVEVNADSPIETNPSEAKKPEPAWQEHVLFDPFDSHERAEYLAQFITENSGVDCYVVSLEEGGHAVTIRYVDGLDFYVETIREATGLSVHM